jgi:hypothetical protein
MTRDQAVEWIKALDQYLDARDDHKHHDERSYNPVITEKYETDRGTRSADRVYGGRGRICGGERRVKTFHLPTLSRRALAKSLRRFWLQLTAPKWARVVWTKRRGKKYRVHTMDDGHLLNTIAYLRREAYERPSWWTPPSWYEHDFTPFVPDPTPRPILNVMIREASRRGFRCTVEAMKDGKLPKWLEEQNAAFGESRKAKRAALLINGENRTKIDDKRAKKRAAEIMRTVIAGKYPG